MRDIEDLGKTFDSLPRQPVYRFVPSSFVAYNTHGCPLKLRLDYPPEKKEEQATGGGPLRSVAGRHKARGIFLEDGLVESLGEGVIRCDTAENKDYPFTHWVAQFSNDLGGPKELLLAQVKVEMTQKLIDHWISCVPERYREAVKARVVFRPMLPDIIRLRKVKCERTNRIEIEVTAVDIKSSSHMKGGHQMQVAMYYHVLDAILAEGNSEGWNYRMNPIGEIWLPQRVASSDKVTFETETFVIQTIDPFLETFFAEVVPAITAYDPSRPGAQYEDIEWTLNDSCVMCPHMADCKKRALDGGLVQVLPCIEKRDWLWLPKKVADITQAAQQKEMTHRLKPLTRGGLLPQAFQQGMPIVRPDGRTLRISSLQIEKIVSIAVCTDPFDGAFKYGAVATIGELPITEFTDAQDFASHVLKLLASCVQHNTHVAVWNEPQRKALMGVLNRYMGTSGLPNILLEETFATFDPVGNPHRCSDDGVRNLSNHVLKMYDLLNEMVVLPVAGRPTLQEALLFLSDPEMRLPFPEYDAVLRAAMPYNIQHEQALDDYFMETEGAERRRNAELITHGMVTIFLNIVSKLSPEQAIGKTGSLQTFNGRKEITKPVSTRNELFDVLRRAITYNTCAAIEDSTKKRLNRYLVRYEPASDEQSEEDPATLTCRFILDNPDLANDFSVPNRCEEDPLTCPSCKDAQGGPIRVAVAQVSLNGRSLGSAPAPAYAIGGSYYYQCPKCEKNGKKWATVESHPNFGNAFAAFGSYLLIKKDSTFELNDVEKIQLKTSNSYWYKQIARFCNPPKGSGVSLVDITDVTASGAIHIARRSFGCFLKPGEEYYLVQRYADFNVGKASAAWECASGAAETTPIGKLALGERWSKESLLPIQQNTRIESTFSKPAFYFYEHVRREPLTILWGPPGTGKTHTLTASILEWARGTKGKVRVLVVACTHKAVAELAERRGKLMNEKGSEVVPPNFHFIHFKEGGEGDVSNDQRDSEDEKSPTLSAAIPKDPENGCVVYCTIWEAYKRWLKPSTKGKPVKVQELFDILVVDEASQMPLAFALIPSLLMKPHCRVILAGDLLQLPPIFNEFKEASQHEKPYIASAIQGVMRDEKNHPVAHAFDILQGQWKSVCPLTVSYRSSPPVVDFVGTLYPQGLGANFMNKYSLSPEVEHFPVKPSAQEELLLETALVTVTGIVAQKEADTIVKVLGLLSTAYQDQEKKTVMVVTPHRRQRDEIKKKIRAAYGPKGAKLSFAKCQVDTADKMQGSEANFVLFALSAVNSASAFIFNVFRLNVAFSRAQQQVILVASDQTLSPPPTVLDTEEGRMAFSHLKRFVDRSEKISMV